MITSTTETEQNKMSKLEKVVTNKVNSIFVRGLRTQKGWSKQEAANHIVDFLYSGTTKNFKDFMESR